MTLASPSLAAGPDLRPLCALPRRPPEPGGRQQPALPRRRLPATAPPGLARPAGPGGGAPGRGGVPAGPGEGGPAAPVLHGGAGVLPEQNAQPVLADGGYQRAGSEGVDPLQIR